MRKIGSGVEDEQKRSRTARIFSYVILGMLVLSSVGYSFLSSIGTSSKDNQSEDGVYPNGNNWVLKIGSSQFAFTHSPEQLSNVSNNVLFNYNSYIGKDLYLDIENPGIKSEITNKLGGAGNIKEACYGNCNRDLPEKTCADYMIIWKEANNNSVVQKENCVFIYGDMKSVESFEYRLFGRL
jgi:hypothetical protein